jgi:hypothetical protein
MAPQFRMFSTQEAAEQVREKKELTHSQKVHIMRAKYPEIPKRSQPLALLDCSVEELKSYEQRLIKEFHFIKEEIEHILTLQPKFLLGLKPDLGLKDEDRYGILVLDEFFCKKHGRGKEFLRSLILRYPYLLNKTKAHVEGVYELLAKNGVPPEEAIKLTFNFPKLFSVKLEKQMEETFHLFKLYNGIERQKVMTMFKGFPYLFCCDTVKMRRFLGEFKKYKMTEDQIIRLVSGTSIKTFCRYRGAKACWESKCQTSRVCSTS